MLSRNLPQSFADSRETGDARQHTISGASPLVLEKMKYFKGYPRSQAASIRAIAWMRSSVGSYHHPRITLAKALQDTNDGTHRISRHNVRVDESRSSLRRQSVQGVIQTADSVCVRAGDIVLFLGMHTMVSSRNRYSCCALTAMGKLTKIYGAALSGGGLDVRRRRRRRGKFGTASQRFKNSHEEERCHARRQTSWVSIKVRLARKIWRVMLRLGLYNGRETCGDVGLPLIVFPCPNVSCGRSLGCAFTNIFCAAQEIQHAGIHCVTELYGPLRPQARHMYHLSLLA